MTKKILIGVAWPYVNGDLHLGHLAGYLLPADIFARYQRLRGNDVLMVSGSDCHGTPITVEADKRKTTPAEVVAKFHPEDIALFKLYQLSYNIYTKTTTENHKKVVQELFLELLKNGFISKGVMQQYYSEADKQFLPDRYVEGTCPHCGAKEQRSDQCENCGRWLADGELIDPVSKLTKSPVTLKDTEHYFLDFEKLSPRLRIYVDSRKDVWRNWVWQETDGWLNEGLKKRAITRDMDWSIELPIAELQKLPAEQQLSDYTGKRIYVWFEAVIGYLSAAVEWSTLRSTPEDKLPVDIIYHATPDQSENWQDWWLNPEAEIYNFMGQDNLVFHTLMWPGQLLGSSKGYTLPLNVIVNKFLNYEGRKFSKSRNWTIDSKVMAEKYGADLIRYYISANFPENKESNFTWDGFVDGVNNELVANLGNLINRTLKFLEAKFAGQVQDEDYIFDPELQQELNNAFTETAAHLHRAEFVMGLQRVMRLTRFGNKFFDEHKIWEVIKTDEAGAKKIILDLLNLINNLKVLMQPFLPQAAAVLSGLLSVPGAEAQEMNQGKIGTDSWQPQFQKTFALTGPVKVLFPKLDRAVVLAQKDLP
jgi:methionyl-tRNA synthetase